jgi:hypothetical protein
VSAVLPFCRSCQNPECRHEFCWHCKKDWSDHETCIFTKLAVGGLIVLSPVIAVVVVAGVLTVCAPVMACNALLPNTVFPGRMSGRSIVRCCYKYGKKLLKNL